MVIIVLPTVGNASECWLLAINLLPLKGAKTLTLDNSFLIMLISSNYITAIKGFFFIPGSKISD